MTKTKLKISFKYDEIEQEGEVIPRTTCTITSNDNIISEESVLLYFKDRANRLMARKYAFAKAVSPDTIANTQLRTTLWKQFRDSMIQPEKGRVHIADVVKSIFGLRCIDDEQKKELTTFLFDLLEEKQPLSKKINEDAPHLIGHILPAAV